MMKKIMKNKQAVIGLIMIIIVMLIAIFAPLLATNNPTQIDIVNKFKNTSEQYPFGTDQLGRCVYSRLIYGARYSLGIAIPALTMILMISVMLATITAYYGGIVDRIFSSICDVVMAFPPLVILLALVSALGQSILNLMLVLVLAMWVWSAKLVRSLVLNIKNKNYIIAAKVAGSSDMKIILKHIIPNIFPLIIVFFSTAVGDMIILVSGFSFLGLGMESSVPEWGAMLSTSKKYMYSKPYLMFYPGLCIFFTVAGFNIFGEALRDIVSSE